MECLKGNLWESFSISTRHTSQLTLSEQEYGLPRILIGDQINTTTLRGNKLVASTKVSLYT